MGRQMQMANGITVFIWSQNQQNQTSLFSSMKRRNIIQGLTQTCPQVLVIGVMRL